MVTQVLAVIQMECMRQLSKVERFCGSLWQKVLRVKLVSKMDVRKDVLQDK